MQTFEATGPVRADVETAHGKIDVATHEAPRIDVDVRPMRGDEASREAAAGTTVTFADGYLRVEVPKRTGWLLNRDPSVLVEIRCPEGSGLGFRTASADVVARGRLGEVRGKTASGDVTVASCAALRADTASGDIRADEVTGDADVKSASGDIRLGRVGGRAELNAVSGDIRVATVAGGASASVVSGDIDLGSVAGDDVSLRSVSGDVEVGVPAGTAVHVDVTSMTGDVRSDLDLGDAPAGDGPVLDIRGRSVSGDVRIRRASVAGLR